MRKVIIWGGGKFKKKINFDAKMEENMRNGFGVKNFSPLNSFILGLNIKHLYDCNYSARESFSEVLIIPFCSR